ncbi:MAG: hypothetical protein ACOC90_05590, partial [Bacteroidota bacterium]
LRPEFTEKLEPGARIVSHDFDMNDWKPDQHAVIKSNKILSDTLVPVSEDERETNSLLHKKLNQKKPLSLLNHDIFYWKVPAKARGQWQWQTNGKEFTMAVDQSFNKIHAKIQAGNTSLTIKNKRLSGERITIRAVNPDTKTRYLLNGRIEKDTIKGKIQIRRDEGQMIENWIAHRN